MGIWSYVPIIASLTMIAGVLVGVLWKLARIDFRVEQMWDVFVKQGPNTPARGRRRYDRTLLVVGRADDREPRKTND